MLVAIVALAAATVAAAAPSRPANTAPTAAVIEKPEKSEKPEKAKEDRGQPVTVDSDKMERFGKESLVIFTGNVVARQNSSVQYADRMERFGKENLVIFSGNVVARRDNSVQYAERVEVYLDEKGDRILRTVSTGNVRIITRDCRTGTARRAEYHELEQRVVLMGGARVWQDDNVVSGETITIYLSQDRSVVQAGTQERVKAVFFPKDQKDKDKEPKKDAGAPKTATACAN